MRLPPKTGTVYKLKGNRRNPWVAKKWVGTKINDEKKTARPVYAVIGTYPRKTDAIRALMQASMSPEEANSEITLEQVYSEWSARKFPDISETLSRSYKNAFAYLAPLHRIPLADLRTSDYELTVERGNVPRTVRRNVQFVLNGIYSYAIAHDYVTKNVSDYTDFQADTEAQIVRKIFTAEEVETLFTSSDVKDQMMLVGIYTGMRPSEIVGLKRSEVDLEHGFFQIIGTKTKSGHNRRFPIHRDILSIVETSYLKSANLGVTEVFLSDRHKAFSYGTYQAHVKKAGHTPHDTRHSFITYAKLSNMDQTAVKRIVGHSDRDVTSGVYTHLDDAFLQSEMEKFRIGL